MKERYLINFFDNDAPKIPEGNVPSGYSELQSRGPAEEFKEKREDISKASRMPRRKLSKMPTEDLTSRDESLDEKEEGLDLQKASGKEIRELLERGEITHKQFVEAIVEMGGFSFQRPPIYAEKPDSPIIIIYEDTHTGSIEVDFDELDFLRTRFDIRFVGMEGWAGKEADEKRGEQLLNGEEDLVEKLINNPDFQITGLEDPELQEQALRLVPAELYMNGYISSKMRSFATENDIEEVKKMKQFEKKMEGYIFGSVEKFNVKSKKEAISLIRDALKSIDIDFDELKKELDVKDGESLSEFSERTTQRREEVRKIILEIRRNKRNEAGAEKMLSALKRKNENVGVMFFGNGHTDGMIKALRKRQDCTILVI